MVNKVQHYVQSRFYIISITWCITIARLLNFICLTNYHKNYFLKDVHLSNCFCESFHELMFIMLNWIIFQVFFIIIILNHLNYLNQLKFAKKIQQMFKKSNFELSNLFILSSNTFCISQLFIHGSPIIEFPKSHQNLLTNEIFSI